jgi:hypothetical protein
MQWLARLAKARAKNTVRRPETVRPRLETLEDRLTPSGWQGIDLSGDPIAFVPQPVSQENLISVVNPLATPISGTYVTGTTLSATAEGVAVGADGSVYVTGLVNDPAASPDQLGYVKKYDPTGAAVYTTEFAAFAGPGSSAEGNGIAVDGSGNAYVSGKAHNVADGSDNGIYLKLDPTGGTAVYFFVQGSGPTGGPVSTNGVSIDTAGDAVFVGMYSPSATEHDLLAARFTATGTETYGFFYTFGPGSSSQGNGTAMPGSGTSTTIVGWANVPGTTTAQNADAVKVDATGMPTAGGILVDPTTDSANAVALDAAGNSYVAGTLDIGGPTQSAAVVKLDPTLATVIWGVSPATTATTGNGIALNATGDVIVTGADSGGQAYITKLSGVDGSTSDYTIFGGTGGSDVGQAVAVRASDGHVFDVGTTNSADFPVTDGSTLNGTTDGFKTEWTI